MPISVELRTKTMKRRPKSPYEVFPDHLELRERLRKTLYYGKLPETDRPSLPMTEAAVDMFQEAAPRGLGRVDTQWASSVGRRACVSPCSLMLGMLYLDRLKNKNPEYLQKVSSSELFLVSMMVASKYLYDEGVDEEVFNDEWAESARMDCEDLNELERDFLDAIDWSLFVKPNQFRDSLVMMEKRIARMKGLEQGYYMYSDLQVLSQDEQFLAVCKQLLQEFCRVVLVCSMTYIASALTLVGSVLAVGCLQSSMAPMDGALQPASPHLSMPSGSVVIPGAQESSSEVRNLSTAVGEEELSQQLEEVVSSLDQKFGPDQHAEEPDDHLGRKYFGIQAPGLLTLTLLKDTVIHFMLGVKQQWHSNTPSSDVDGHGKCRCDENLEHPAKCSCPNCPAKKETAKQNITRELEASRLELNKDVTKKRVGKLPVWCAADAAPAKHGTELCAQKTSSLQELLPKTVRLPCGVPYQVSPPLGTDVGVRSHSVTKTLVV